MDDKQRHLATFQNLCIIASADGRLDQKELALLDELAESMGLAEEETSPLIQKGEDQAFIVPDNEADCLMEIRMMVLMILADETIHPEEYNACVEVARLMEVSKDYLDETIEFYKYKQLEKKYNLGMFRNLFLVAIADGQIDEEERQLLLEVAHQLGISQSDIDYFLANSEKLELEIPEDENERYYSLKNLVYMMVVNGEIHDKEYDLCLAFAEACGFTVVDIEKIISEYQDLARERFQTQHEIDRQNIDIYLDAFNALEQLEKPTAQIVGYIQDLLHTRSLRYFHNLTEQEEEVIFKVIWLMIVRSSMLTPESTIMLPVYLDLSRKHRNFRDLRDFLIHNEQTFGGSPVELPQLYAEQIKKQILQDLKQIVLVPSKRDLDQPEL